jgi:hypothetical protein
VLELIKKRVEEKKESLKKISGVFKYIIKKDGENDENWNVEIKKNSVKKGKKKSGKEECKIKLDEEEMVKIE